MGRLGGETCLDRATGDEARGDDGNGGDDRNKGSDADVAHGVKGSELNKGKQDAHSHETPHPEADLSGRRSKERESQRESEKEVRRRGGEESEETWEDWAHLFQ